MNRSLRLYSALVAAGTLTLLAGCATGYLLDNRVQSFSGFQALPASPTYRFERLPLQQADPVQVQLEGLADAALFKAGFRRDDARPAYSVQVSARVQPALSPYADPRDRWGWGWGFGFWGRRGGLGTGLSTMDTPWYQREVGIVVRDIASNKVVYESHAANDGPYRDNSKVLPAMFEAALQGFPNPPPGVRRVDINLPG